MINFAQSAGTASPDRGSLTAPLAAALVVLALVLGGLVALPAAASAATASPPCAGVTRIADAWAVDRAAALSRQRFPAGATIVVVARSDAYADALTGGPLATRLGAPILLTHSDRLSDAAATEVRRLGAHTAVLLGGTEALPRRLESELREGGVKTVVRHGGRDRYGTSRLVAEALLAVSGADRVYVAAGSSSSENGGWPDAIAVSALAARTGRPVLLTQSGSLPQDTRAVLSRGGIRAVTIVGGPSVVTEAVRTQVAAVVPATDRIFGQDRYGTSRAVVERALAEGARPSPLYVTSGTWYTDALIAAPVAGAAGGLMLLAGEGGWTGSSVAKFAADHPGQVTDVRFIGAPNRLSDDLVRGACQVVGRRTAATPTPSARPTIRPTPTPTPSALPTIRPTATPTPTPSARPAVSPAPSPSARPVPPPSTPVRGRVFHIAPTSSGSGNGSNWANAGDLADLPTFVAAAQPGEEVWLNGELGPYRTTQTITIREGGLAGSPVIVRGVAADGSDRAMPLITGTRTFPNGTNHGREVFRLMQGANHLRFSNLSFRDQGNGCFYLAGPVTGIAITDMKATNVRRFIENYTASGGPTASVTDLQVRDVRVDGFSRGVARLQYNTSNVLFEDVYGDSQRQMGDDFAMGIMLDGTVHDVTHRRVTLRNGHSQSGSYWNGDGFVAENATYRLVYEDTLAAGHTDGGYDLKADDTQLIRARAEDNKRNFRFWGDRVTVRDCIGSAPYRRGGSGTQAQVWSSGQVRLEGCTFTDSSAATVVFDLDDGADVTVVGGSVQRNSASRLSSVDSTSRLTLQGVNGT